MNKSTSSIDNLKIASLCPAKWEGMQGDALTRFCRQCNLNVYNLSAMTWQEATAVVAQTEGRVCVKYFQRQDGTVITADCPVGLKLLRERVAGITSVVLAAVMSLVFFAEGIFATTNAGKRKPRRHSTQARKKFRPPLRATIGVMIMVNDSLGIFAASFSSDVPPPQLKNEPDQSPPQKNSNRYSLIKKIIGRTSSSGVHSQ